jgi:hypothetical protein
MKCDKIAIAKKATIGKNKISGYQTSCGLKLLNGK